MTHPKSSPSLFLLLVLGSLLILSQSCGHDDHAVFPGFVVCSQLTSNPLQTSIVSINEPMGEPTTLVAVQGHSAIDPVVTPDGKTMVFSANFEKPTPTGNDPPGGLLYRMDLAGRNYTRITDDDFTSTYERSPAISPDGATIVFVRSDKEIGPLEALDRLWMVQLDGSNKHPVFDDENPRNDYSPAFSPDGTKLVYLSDNNSVFVNVTWYDLKSGGNPVKLTNLSSVQDSVYFPFFDDSGQRVYFMLNSNGVYSMNRISVSGGEPEKVFDIPSVDMPKHNIIDAPGYIGCKPTRDYRHFVCTGTINDAYQVFTADNLNSPFSPAAATTASYDYQYPFWYRP
jgi:dipeptidyl aminopeptidase/acylaminoacyl peptidase